MPGRGAHHARELYAGIKPGAVLMTDGYELYSGIAHGHQLVHLGCWVHVRRGFIKAEQAAPKAARSPNLVATQFVAMIGKLFAAEKRSHGWTPQRCQQLRARYSTRVLVRIQTMMSEHLLTVVPSSMLGRSLHYLRGQWSKLVRYVQNGDWPISNNFCENAIRLWVVERKSWMFADTVAGAHASDNFYSLVETCRANGIEPYRYLTWLFTQVPLASTVDDYGALLPWSIPAHLR